MADYKVFGVMADVSRNAVLTMPAMKKFIDCIAKMGYNAFEIYAEDIYKLDGEPFFGYLRGGYSKEDLKELDAFAKERGVELIPCIQTLGHFTAISRIPHYKGTVIDTDDILLIDEEKTYALIEKLFATCAECFTSKKINIGMDEAHNVGLGKYLDRHGYVNRFELINKHLQKVAKIAEKYGYNPHMWSDMYFRLANNGVYHKPAEFDKEILDSIPKNIELTYWDYYRETNGEYEMMIESHKQFNRPIWFAGACWTWTGFAPMNYRSLKVMKPAMESVRKYGVENVLITVWGDHGGECSYFSTLPALYAIRQYADGNFDEEKIKAGFEKLFGVSYDDMSLLDLPNLTEKAVAEQRCENPSKAMLYTDCLMGYYDFYVTKHKPIPYGEYASKLKQAKARAGEYAYLFEAMGKLCSVLEIKFYIGYRTRKAYREGDKKALKVIVKDYKKLIIRLEEFYKAYREMWFAEKKPFGWEVQDLRLGGLIRRVTHCKETIEKYLSGKLDKILELEEDILDLNMELDLLFSINHQILVSRSNLYS